MKKSFLLPFLLFAALCVAIVSSTPTNKETAKANKTAVDNHAQLCNLQNVSTGCCAPTCHSPAPPILQNDVAMQPGTKDEHSRSTANKSRYGDDDEQAAIITATSFIGAVTIPKAMPDIPINIATTFTEQKPNTLQQTTANGIPTDIAAFTDTGQNPSTALNNSATGWSRSDGNSTNTNNTLRDTGQQITAWNTVDGTLAAAGCNSNASSAHCQEGINT